MAQRPKRAPGEAVPVNGIYEQRNIFGRPTTYGSPWRISSRCHARRTGTPGR